MERTVVIAGSREGRLNKKDMMTCGRRRVANGGPRTPRLRGSDGYFWCIRLD